MTKIILILILIFSISLNAKNYKDGDVLLESSIKNNSLDSKNTKLKINQKYVCFSLGMEVMDKFIPTSKKNQLEYPSRFFIDKNLVLHKDNGSIHYNVEYNKNKGIVFKNSSKNEHTMIMYQRDKLILLVMGNKIQGLEATYFYKCMWTDNWTLTK